LGHGPIPAIVDRELLKTLDELRLKSPHTQHRHKEPITGKPELPVLSKFFLADPLVVLRDFFLSLSFFFFRLQIAFLHAL